VSIIINEGMGGSCGAGWGGGGGMAPLARSVLARVTRPKKRGTSIKTRVTYFIGASFVRGGLNSGVFKGSREGSVVAIALLGNNGDLRSIVSTLLWI